jgi:oligopeptide/dipeptide ABC transporter ATP-binding protein
VSASSNAPILEVRGLSVRFPGANGPVTVVDGVDLTVFPGQRFAIVGESGSGKSVTLLSVLGLIDPPGEVRADLIRLNGHDLDPNDNETFKRVRGRDVALVMQDPLAALSPVFSIGDQLVETIRAHRPAPRRAALAEAIELLQAVDIPDPHRRVRDYPHQFSGGMRQRVAIALALACEPPLLLADEPTTALDVTISAQMIDLMRRLSEERGMAVVMVSHDLGVLAGFAGAMAVMYAGRVVEQGEVDRVYPNPAHPYTRALLASQPRIRESQRERLPVIPGQPPDPARLPQGCSFHPRCSLSRGREICQQDAPHLRHVAAPARWAACHFAEEQLTGAVPGPTGLAS